VGGARTSLCAQSSPKSLRHKCQTACLLACLDLIVVPLDKVQSGAMTILPLS
jgi:hypothetical protein